MKGGFHPKWVFPPPKGEGGGGSNGFAPKPPAGFFLPVPGWQFFLGGGIIHHPRSSGWSVQMGGTGAIKEPKRQNERQQRK